MSSQSQNIGSWTSNSQHHGNSGQCLYVIGQPALGWHIYSLCLNESSLKHRTGSSWVSGFSCSGFLKVHLPSLGWAFSVLGCWKRPIHTFWCWCQFPSTFFAVKSARAYIRAPTWLHASPLLKQEKSQLRTKHTHTLYVFNLCKEMYLTIRTSWSGLKYLYLLNINYTLGIVT